VVRLKSRWVVNLDQGDKKGRHCDCGFECGHTIGYPFLARPWGRTGRLSRLRLWSGLQLAVAGRSALEPRQHTDTMLWHMRRCG
jgi:hypothetical protein